MASEVTRLYFNQLGSDETKSNNQFIDLAACMTVVNRKQYHHTARDGTPLCYAYTAHVAEDDGGAEFKLLSVPNNWTMRNAVKMTAAAWKAQLKNGGIKLRDLPVYGRRLRVGWDRDALNATGAPVDQESWLDNQCYPVDASGAAMAGGYTASDGTSITFEHAHEVTQIVGGDEVFLRVCVASGTSTAGNTLTFGCWEEYLDYRRSSPDVDLSMEETDESIMSTLFATSEELSDDILEAVKDDMNYKPYNETLYQMISAQVIPAAQVTSCSGVAPCGLLRLDVTTAAELFYIDVHAIYEM